MDCYDYNFQATVVLESENKTSKILRRISVTRTAEKKLMQNQIEYKFAT